MKTVPIEPFYNKSELGKHLNITVRTIDNWMKNGIIPYYKIGRSIRFKIQEVDKHLLETNKIIRAPVRHVDELELQDTP